MDKNDQITLPERKDKSKQIVIIPLMVMAVLLIADLYVMVNMPQNYLALIIVTIPFLASAYFFGAGILKEMQNSKLRAEEQYEAISKSGKASYLLLKKAFEQLEEIEGSSKKPAEDIITAQKAIAKVTISRNKENTDALMNSNDKVLEKIFDFEENLGNNQNDLLDKQKDMIDNSMKELMQQQQEMASNMRALEESIKNELLSAMNSIQASQQAVQQTVQSVAQPVETTSVEEPEVIEDIDLVTTESPADTLDLGEEIALGEDLNLGENLDLGDDLNLGENLDLGDDLNLGESLDLGDDLNLGENLDLGDDLNLGEDLDLGEDLNLGEDLGLGEDLNLGENLDLGDDLNLGEDLGLGEDLNLGENLDLGEEVKPDEEIDLGMSESLEVEEPTIPADMDLGIDLLPEDEEIVEEPVVEEVVEEPVAEEAKQEVPMPDLSDPHKLMTPEEIAALIANM